jgi:DNA-binding response OmpR family regulator
MAIMTNAFLQPTELFTTKYHVLLVEDDLIVQTAHRRFLEKIGCQVDVAGNGQQALALYKPNKYHIVILDAGLPGITGFDLANIIRSQESNNQRQYLILLSAFDYDDVKNKCAEADIDDFAIKPVNFENLKTMITNALMKNNHA